MPAVKLVRMMPWGKISLIRFPQIVVLVYRAAARPGINLSTCPILIFNIRGSNTHAIMAAVQVRGAQQSSNNQSTGIAVSIGIVLLIIISAYLVLRFHRKTDWPINLRHLQHLQHPQREERIELRTLEKLPIFAYKAGIYRKDIGQNAEKTGRQRHHKLKKTYSCRWLRRFPSPTPSLSILQEASTTIEEAAICSICVSAFRDGDIVRMLPCNHIYHRGCIDEWLMNYLPGTCPLW
jgi:hypothetical protein